MVRLSYAELHCLSNFSFLQGASHPEDLATRAASLGLPALALTDRDGLHGIVRFDTAARQAGLKPIFGSELGLEDGTRLVLLAQDETGYRNLEGQFAGQFANAAAARKLIEQSGLTFFGTHIFLEKYDPLTNIAPLSLIQRVAFGAASQKRSPSRAASGRRKESPVGGAQTTLMDVAPPLTRTRTRSRAVA